MADDRWLIVGLGNPGPAYARNRHNIGFLVADSLSVRMGARFRTHKARAVAAVGRLAGQQAVLVKPWSYMNLSGGPAAAERDFYKVPLERIIVVHDDLDLEFGVLRVKQGGGAGGHNGLRSLTRSLGGPGYLRVRFGIGRPPGRMDPAAYVLKDFAAAERRVLDVEIERACDVVEALMRDGLTATQNDLHAP